MNATSYSTSNSSIVVATPKQLTVEILRQSDAILELKKRMKPGVHFGPPYPGSKKETLLKPGAEWLAKRFGLRSHYEELTKRIDINFDQPDRTFILLEYRCLMIDIESGVVVGEAIGSCNSREDKYAWRWVSEFDVPAHLDKSRLVSKDGSISEFKFAVEKKQTSGQYGKPADYWQMFTDAIANGTARSIKRQTKTGESEAWEIGGRTYRVPHDNPLDQLNTFSKMAQKRSKVSSVMEATGASAYFAPGDDEVKDIYVEDGDIEVIDAEFEVVKNEPPQPSRPATVTGAGISADKPAEPDPLNWTDETPNTSALNLITVLNSALAEKLVRSKAQFDKVITDLKEDGTVKDTSTDAETLEAVRKWFHHKEGLGQQYADAQMEVREMERD